jgi:drug/metabolite transporter (DMT)-like permease
MPAREAAPAGGRPSAILPYGAALGAIVCWATLAAALYRSLGALAPQQVLAYGMGVAGIALLAWDWMRGFPPWRTFPGVRSLALGLYGIFGYHALLVGAFALAPPVQANVLNYTWPLWIIVLGGAGTGQPLTLRPALGGIVGLAGTVVALEPWRGAPPGGAAPWIGYALALGAGFCWGSFTVLLRHTPGAGRALGWWCAQAAGVAALWMVAGNVPFRIGGESLLAVAYVGLLPLGAAFALWEVAARRCALRTLGLLSYLTPPLSTVLLGWVAGRSASGWAWTGLGLVVGGAAFGGMRRRSISVSQFGNS